MLKWTTICAATSLAMLTACQESSVTGSSDAKSVEHYSSHPDEAKSVAEKCMVFERGEFSTMPPGKQTAWSQTTDGINCRNARQAAVVLLMQERQRKLSEAAGRYK